MILGLIVIAILDWLEILTAVIDNNNFLAVLCNILSDKKT